MAHPEGGSTQAGRTTLLDPTNTNQSMTQEDSGVVKIKDELWSACAGDWTDFPEEGQHVYYFPQGQMEQLEDWLKEEINQQLPQLNIPSKFWCRVAKVERQVERDTDEIYVRLTLHPELKKRQPTSPEPEQPELPQRRQPVRWYSKILTASDASANGGFSIPKKLAVECLPPLDMSQDTPAQELVVKDAHGWEWRFRHIFRGQPRRHLLTTGWAAFVHAKELVAGDELVFLRWVDGTIGVGVRRHCPGKQSILSALIISSQIIHLGVISSSSHSIGAETVFCVHCKPRTSQFLIGPNKYLKANSQAFHVGMRVKSTADDALTAGTIVDIGDYSHLWPRSQWRSLKVQWDQPEARIGQPDRVSPWEVEPLATTSPCLLSVIPDQMIVRKKRSRPATDIPPSQARTSFRGPISVQAHEQGNDGTNGHANVEGRPYGILKPLARYSNISAELLTNLTAKFNGASTSSVASDPLGPWKEQMDKLQRASYNLTGCRVFGVDLANRSSLTQKQPAADSFANKEANVPAADHLYSWLQCISESTHVKNQPNGSGVFGPLTGEQCMRTRTKVHMEGAAFGRTIDLAELNGYEDLTTILEKMFGIKGELSTGEKWVVVFTDDEGDLMLVGDDPWPEFCKMVKKIVICSSEEVKKMKGRFKLVMSPLEGEGTLAASRGGSNRAPM